MHRRTFLGASAALAVNAYPQSGFAAEHGVSQESREHPVRSIVPVVGDGKWIWTKPPQETGQLEPRDFNARVGIYLTGRGNATQVKATTVAPINAPEQTITNVQIKTQGCAAAIRQLTPDASQLLLVAPQLLKDQEIYAMAEFKLTIHKTHLAYKKAQFPAAQEFPKDFKKWYMYDSPGIQTRQREVKELAAKIAGQIEHPWDKAKAFYDWVWHEIKPRIQSYTSVMEAIRDRFGDCEEKAAVFIALCRVSGIPSRLVWVPNHNWAEICLRDEQGSPHWIPIHTSCYSWFGWTGAHEMVLQKGDNIKTPEQYKPLRLLADWRQWQGARPKARYFANIEPAPVESGEELGPGARTKDEKGEWKPQGKFVDARFVRR